jgi:hypothetical protein
VPRGFLDAVATAAAKRAAAVAPRAQQHVKFPEAVQPLGHVACLRVELAGDIPLQHALLYRGGSVT